MKKRFVWLGIVLLMQMTYFPINRLASGGRMLQISLDAYLPLLPLWTVPYLLALPWWLGSLAWAAVRMPARLYRSLLLAAVLVIATGTLVYIFFPTFVARTPVSAQGWAADLLRYVYQSDRTYNAFPSSHTYLTVLIGLFWWRWKPDLRPLWGGIMLIVLLSTLFTGQHVILDVLGGIALAVLGYTIGLSAEPYLWRSLKG